MDPSYDLAVVRLFVHDWERALRFYTEALGMRLEGRADEFGWAQFATGTCRLAVERHAGVSLRVPDIHAAAHLRDPEGNVLTLLG
jgi:catechol 2,3-dioxygenase-like lactoylglutathione lyase family enzyme